MTSDATNERDVATGSEALVFPDALVSSATRLLADCRAAHVQLATAESCTGGLIAGLLTEIAGSSSVVDRGFVTYSNEAKTEVLGVPAAMLAEHGAVSEQVARAMARGALLRSKADIAVAVTGIAGPGGGSEAKPVGLVHVATARVHRDSMHRACRFGDLGRAGIRLATLQVALEMIRAALEGGEPGGKD
jgi:nicotinamide-nucleotide amidase